jgi:ABC-2 type transport system ATP-binding protein
MPMRSRREYRFYSYGDSSLLLSIPDPILDIRNLQKTYKGGNTALNGVDLQIRKGEIFALLGPNGAGKTTLIGAVCGLVRPTGGRSTPSGWTLQRHWREVRRRIGLVPQELSFDMFDQVDPPVRYSRGLFGYAADRRGSRKCCARSACGTSARSRSASSRAG